MWRRHWRLPGSHEWRPRKPSNYAIVRRQDSDRPIMLDLVSVSTSSSDPDLAANRAQTTPLGRILRSPARRRWSALAAMRSTIDYFSEESLRSDLKRKTVRGGLYTAAGQAGVALIALATVPIMARLLRPADFGLVAMVTVFTGFAAMFVDAGLSMATIQRDKINHQQVSNLFWVAAVLGVLIALVVSALSPAIAWFYREPRIVPITIALSTSFVFSGLTIQHQALLRRAMRFKALAVLQIACYALSYAVTIAIAWYYRSYWALVALPITAALLRMVTSWWVSGWRPALPRRGVGMRGLVGFGANLTGFSFVNYFARTADNMLVGWWWGEVPLGYYERGYRLMMAPLRQINAPLTNLLVPVLSRVQNQEASYRRVYFQAVGVLQAVSCPLMAFVAVTAPWVVDVVFGPGWEEVGPILRWLAIAGFLQPLGNSLGWLYISQGRGRDLMVWGLVGGSLIVLSFVLGLAWGPVGVARAYALMICFVVVPLSYWYAGHKGPVTARDLAWLTTLAVLYATPTVLVSAFVLYRFPHLSSGAGIALSGAGSAIASGLAVVSTKAGRSFVIETSKLLHHAIRPTLPRASSAHTSPPNQ